MTGVQTCALPICSLNNDEHKRVDIVSTFLGAHAVPEEYKGRTDEYLDFIISDILPCVAKNELAEFCDVFCEQGVFSVEQSRRLLQAAKEYGLGLKLHADEIEKHLLRDIHYIWLAGNEHPDFITINRFRNRVKERRK